jgi:hypothetical protein
MAHKRKPIGRHTDTGDLPGTSTTSSPRPLLPEWAFVVQFREETAVEQGHIEGRVEHVVSGQATRFHSVEELLAFIAQVLTAVPMPPPATR